MPETVVTTHIFTFRIEFSAQTVKQRHYTTFTYEVASTAKLLVTMTMVRRLVAYLVALVGCVWQIYTVSDQYFQFTIATQVTIAIDEYLQLPQTMICLAIPHNLRNQTASAIFKQLPPPSDFLIEYTILDADESVMIDLRRTGREQEILSSVHIKIMLACYMFSLKQPPVIRSEAYKAIFVSILTVNTTVVFPGREPIVVLGFHPNGKKSNSLNVPFQLHWQTLDKNGKPSLINEKIMVRYTHFSSELLPAPFATNCIDYAIDTQFESKDHCIDVCATDLYLKEFNLFPAYTLIDKPRDSRIDLFADKGTIKRKNQIAEHCREKCSANDCKFDRFLIDIATEIPEDYVDVTSVNLLKPISPRYSIKYAAMMQPADYVTYVLSCVSFWIGFCPLSFIMTFHVEQLFNRNADNSNRNRSPSSSRLINLEAKQKRCLNIVQSLRSQLEASRTHYDLKLSLMEDKLRFVSSNARK